MSSFVRTRMVIRNERQFWPWRIEVSDPAIEGFANSSPQMNCRPSDHWGRHFDRVTQHVYFVRCN